ncbi:MAG TPA: PIG-L family deacetylase [Herpetosiphonaceae bacterium]
MLIESLTAARGYEHVYIAPHLDDAVLSCGGRIALQVDGGQPVLVVTICAGRPAASAELSPFAQYLHSAWALGDDPVGLRREEDRRALASLGCAGLHLGELDAPYRVADYGARDAVFGTPVTGDPLAEALEPILTQLHAQQPQARLYMPLGVGQHVDHQLVCAAGLMLHEQGADVVWYEDAPYAARQPHALTERLAALSEQFVPEAIAIDAALERKLAAIRAYRSQLAELFGAVGMEQVMTAYAATVGDGQHRFGERIWRREQPQR